jgi:hypothetical protein
VVSHHKPKPKTADNNPNTIRQAPKNFLFLSKKPHPRYCKNNPRKAPAKESSNSSPEWWTVYLTAVLAAIGIMQTIVFGLQAHRLKQTIEAMKKIGADQSRDMQASIAAAEKSADIAERTIAATQRPWISIDIGINGDLVFDANGNAKVHLLFTLNNIGRSPATNVRVNPYTFLNSPKRLDVLAEYRNFVL